MNTIDKEYDVVVIGGGPAGLQAALTSGRMHRQVLLLDSGQYRNESADLLHNFVTHDGRPPAEFRALARAELALYESVEVRAETAVAVHGDDRGFEVATERGTVRARRIVLATGVRDTLPPLPGLERLFGTVAAHCPFCHGHEFSGEHVAVLGSHAHVARVALMLERIAGRLTVLADGGTLDADTAALLARTGVGVRPEPVHSVTPTEGGAVIRFAEGPDEHVGGLMVSTTIAQSAPFAAQLGLTVLASGCIEIDHLGRTSLPGVYAAGDLAHHAALPMPMASVLSAAAAGQLAASGIEADLLAYDHGVGVPG